MELQNSLPVADMMSMDSFMLSVLAVMLSAGVLGGLANYYLSERYARGGQEKTKYIVLGVVAALVVPLLLNMLSSNLIAMARANPYDMFVFAGVCLVFVVLTRRWFENLAQKLINKVEAVEEEVSQIRSLQSLAENVVPASPVAAAAADIALPEAAEANVSDLGKLGYNDVELLRAVGDGKYAYGNISGIAADAGLSRDFVNERLVVLKNMGLLELKIDEKNVLHWFLAARGKQFLGDVLAEKEE